MTSLAPCPVCGSPARPTVVNAPNAVDPVGCSAPAYLYAEPERGGCVLARRWFNRSEWNKLTKAVLLDPAVFSQPQAVPRGWVPWPGRAPQEPVTRPPLGLTPRAVWAEKMPAENREPFLRDRLLAVLAASTRYAIAGKYIPTEWILEIAELHNWVGAKP